MNQPRLKTVYWRRRLVASLLVVGVVAPALIVSGARITRYLTEVERTSAAMSTKVDYAFTATAGGTTQYGEAPTQIVPATGGGTVESWVYYDSTNSQQAAIMSSGNGFLVATSGDMTIRGGNSWNTQVALPKQRWVHVALTWAGPAAAAAVLYIDGQQAASTSNEFNVFPGGSGGTPAGFRVGRQWGTYSEEFPGMIDEVRVWNTQRSASDIAANFNTRVASHANLLAYYDFNQDSGSTVNPAGGSTSNANGALTLNNSPTFTEQAAPDTNSRTGWTLRTFKRSYITASGGWTVPSGVTAVETLVVGGGGGGGSHVGGGGGGGGVRTSTSTSVTAGSAVTVTVGMGGRGAKSVGPNSGHTLPNHGGSSTFASITSLGGGRGATVFSAPGSVALGDNVATGGGASCCGFKAGGTGTSGQGSAGGNAFSHDGTPDAQPHATGGGGGAGGVGGTGVQPNINSSVSGNGGAGAPSTITGAAVSYGGGGGGSAHGVTNSSPYIPGTPGTGVDGGGDGSVPVGATHLSGTIAAESGTANTGGGGGGAAAQYDGFNGGAAVTSIGGNGGSGIVVVAYANDTCTETSATNVTVGGIAYKYKRWTTTDTDATDGSHNGDDTCIDTFTVPSGVTSLEVLVAAGGGGAGYSQSSSYLVGGGGGGGGVIFDTTSVTPGTAITLRVGNGGAGATANDTVAPNGANSTFGALTAIGGGGGGNEPYDGAAGGAGGGGGGGTSGTSAGGQTCTQAAIGMAGGTGTSGQGYDASVRGCWGWSGSGGGAGSPSYIGGSNGYTYPGFPLTVSITGSPLDVGAGGPATGWGPGTDHPAGSGGGGRHTYGAPAGTEGNGRAGASGTVIVRWAVDSADTPAVTDHFARYRAGDYNATNKVWADSSGNGRHVNFSTATVTGSPTRSTTGSNANGSTVQFPVVSGTASADSTPVDWIEFPSAVLPNNYTMQHVARFDTSADQTGRIFNSRDLYNFLSGFWQGKSGVAHHGDAGSVSGWITQSSVSQHGSNWVLSSDSQKTGSANARYRSQGVNRTICGSCGLAFTDAPRLAINKGNYDESADWQVADILVFDRTLTDTELRANELHLNRLYGITTPGLQATGVSATKVAASTSSLDVTWTPAGDVTPSAQTLQVSTDGSSWSTATTAAAVTGTSTAATVTGLSSGTTYYFRVLTDLTGISNETPSAASTGVATYTATTVSLTNSTSPRSGETVTLSATVVPSTSGAVAFAADGTTITGCGSVALSSGTATCDWIPPSAATYSVTATFGGSASHLGSSDTESIVVINPVPGAITNLAAEGHGPGRLDLTWSAPSGNVTDYVIEYALAGSGSWQTFTDSVSANTGTTITDLVEDTRYDVRVIAKDGSVAGPASNTATAWTHIDIVTSFTAEGSHTWRSRHDIDLVDLLLVGGGGGGGAGRSGTWYGAGGGGEGGSYTRSSRNVTPNSDHSITVGAGGSGGASNGVSGSSGGSTSFNGVVTAAGGAAGAASAALNTGGMGGTGGNGGDGGQGSDGADGGTHQASSTWPQNGAAGNQVVLRDTTYCVGGGGGGGQRGVDDSRWSFAGSAGSCGATRSGGKGNYYDHASTRTYITAQSGVDGTGGGGGGGAHTSGAAYPGASGGSGRVTVVGAVPVLVTSSSLSAATYGSAYASTAPTWRGRHTPLVWSATGLPSWATLDTSTGVISGIPTAVDTWTVTLTLTDANGDYDVVTHDLTSSKANQTLTFNYSGNKTYGDPDFAVDATTTSGLVASFATDTPSVCSVTGNETATAGRTGAVVTVLAAGTCNVTAAQVGDSGWNPATAVTRSFTVAAAAQSTLALVATTSTTFGNTVTLGTTGGSGTGAVSYSLVGGAGSASCTITTDVVSFGSAGTCTVRATKAADVRYTAASSSDATITVAKATQSVSFTSSVPASPVVGGTYSLTATATSSLDPSFSVITGSGTVCSLSGSTVTFLATGRCEVGANQAGDARYSEATRASQIITVGKRNQNISFGQPADMNFGDADTSLGVTASSGLDVTLVSDTPTVCSVTGGIMSIVAVGECQLTATQDGNATWAPASTVVRTFRVVAALPTAPMVTSVSAANASLTLAFTTPAFDGGAAISGYRIVVTSSVGSQQVYDTCTFSPCTLEGLDNGTAYTATVAARNSVGVGPASAGSPAATPVTRATAPSAISAVPGPSTLTVSWQQPESLGGGTFAEYQLRIRTKGGAWPTSPNVSIPSLTTLTHTFTDLANGVEYEVQIVTITSANTTPFVGNTGEMFAVPVTTPSAPRDLTVSLVSMRSIRVAWATPLSDGGAPVTSYAVGIDNGATCGSITASTTTLSGACEVTGLTGGTTYTIQVAATNRIGSGVPAVETYVVPTIDPSGTTATSPETPAGQRTEPKKTAAGTLARPKSGTSIAITADGKTIRPKTTVGDGKVTARVGRVVLGIEAAPGSSAYTNSVGQLVVRIPGRLLVTGSGLMPGARVTVWMMSTPTRLGDAVADENGKLRRAFSLPSGLRTGQHTIQIETLDAAGKEITMAFGVSATHRAIPVTGNGPWPLLLWALLAVGLGFGLFVVSRRRHGPAK